MLKAQGVDRAAWASNHAFGFSIDCNPLVKQYVSTLFCSAFYDYM